MKRKALISLGVLAIVAVIGGVILHTGTEESGLNGVAVVEDFINLEYDKSMETAYNDIEEAKKQAEEDATEEEEAIVEQEVEQGLLEVPEEVAVKELDTYLYATTDVSLREGASVGSEKLGTVMTGTKVHAIGQTEDNQWIKVEGIEGKEGFISSSYLQETAPTQDEQVAVQQQQEQQAELEQQAQANQEAQAAENKSQDEAAAYVMKVAEELGANTNGLRDVPSSVYNPNAGDGLSWIHAE